MPLTDAEIRRAAPRPKPWKLFDGGGLHLLISPNGSKLWRLKYRFQGKELQAAFGPYPIIPLREARQKRDDFRRALMTGEDPTAPKRGRTFEAVAREFIEKQVKRLKPRYRADALRRLELNIFRDIGAQPIGTIEAPNLQAMMALYKKVKASEDEAPVTRLGLLVLAHTAVRTSELIKAEWKEVQENEWVIPGLRMKMDKPHIVPLSRQARGCFEALRCINGDSRFIFASPTNADKHISNNTLLWISFKNDGPRLPKLLFNDLQRRTREEIARFRPRSCRTSA